jgi:hypothetical protein
MVGKAGVPPLWMAHTGTMRFCSPFPIPPITTSGSAF